LERGSHETKGEDEGVLTKVKMEAEMAQRRAGEVITMLRSSAASQNRRRSTKRRNPRLVLELGFQREMASSIRRIGVRMGHRGESG
jgi:hypothetical protein